MKNSVEIIDILDQRIIGLNRSQAVTTPENKSYFQGMIDSLKDLRELLMKDVSEHHAKINAILDKM